MGLINCPECNKQVSDKAATCPQCGHPIATPKAPAPPPMPPPQPQQKKKTSPAAWGCLVIIGIFVLGGILGKCGSSGTTTRTPQQEIEEKVPDWLDLNAHVQFDSTQFVITNNDAFNWRNVKLEINSGLLRGGYILKVPVMTAGQTYTVGAAQFAKGDGTRFNPFTMKLLKLAILADVKNTKGTAYLSWE